MATTTIPRRAKRRGERERTKVYPLHDLPGRFAANSFLLAIEEAANGDYQDYVFVLRNATVAP